MNDYLQKAYAFDKTIIVYAATTTQICRQAQENFNMWPTSAAALGRTLTMTAIMSSMYKSGERLTVKICGDGPIGQVTTEGSCGKVRGFVNNPGVYLSYNNGKLNVKDAIGNGYIEVIKDLNLKQPFYSTSEIISGEIVEDFSYYFATSEQIPSAVGLGVLFDETAKVKAAGGFLIQVMPNCKEETITFLENRLKTLKSCSNMIDEGYTPEDIINEITAQNCQFLEQIELSYYCPCSKERFAEGLLTLGVEELTDILNTDGHAEITCNFCNKKYDFNEQDLKELIALAVKKRNV